MRQVYPESFVRLGRGDDGPPARDEPLAELKGQSFTAKVDAGPDKAK